MRRLFALLCVAAGFFVCAASWHRATANTWETGPRKLAWTDATGRPSDGVGCGTRSFGTKFLVENRLLVPCSDGYAWLDPERGLAKRAWPYDSMWPRAFAVGPDGRWGMLFERSNGAAYELAVALAHRDGWLVEPQTVSTVDNAWYRPKPLAMRWRDGGIDVVLTRPDKADPFGSQHAPELVRLTPQSLDRELLPYDCEYCSVEGARPTATSYEVVRRDLTSDKQFAVARPGVVSDQIKTGGRRYELAGDELVESADQRRIPRADGAYLVEDDGDYITVDAEGRRVDRLSLRAHLGARTGWLLYAMCGLPFAIAIGLVLAMLRRSDRLAPVAVMCALYAGTAALALRSLLEVL